MVAKDTPVSAKLNDTMSPKVRSDDGGDGTDKEANVT